MPICTIPFLVKYYYALSFYNATDICYKTCSVVIVAVFPVQQ